MVRVWDCVAAVTAVAVFVDVITVVILGTDLSPLIADSLSHCLLSGGILLWLDKGYALKVMNKKK